MDFTGQAAIVIEKLNAYRNSNSEISTLIKEVCSLFDAAEKIELQSSDYQFLQFISSEIGLPQYYDLLCRKKNMKSNSLGLSDLLSIMQDAQLIVDGDVILHRYQKLVYDHFAEGNSNRFFLSAPTSFGKTFIIYQIIRKMCYENVVLIFPTIALLGENYLKLLELQKASDFWSTYTIHTLSEEDSAEGKNLWIYTPERFMSFTDKHPNQVFDFIFMDEIYKIDNQYIIDIETVGENERDISFRVALYDTCLRAKDILLAGPYVTFPSKKQNLSLNYFLNDNDFKVLNYNDIEIVNKNYLSVQNKEQYYIDDIRFTVTNKETKNKLFNILTAIERETSGSADLSKNNGTIVYCGRKLQTESLANYLIKHGIAASPMTANRLVFIRHLSHVFGSDWIVVKALEFGIGIHHGLVPKYVQREIIELFNNGDINILLSTTTITEGINTTAKNVIVMSNTKGKKLLKHFDAQNIAGRAGRFNSHYSGRVIAIDNNFLDTLFDDGDCLTHKNYDSNRDKTDVDIEISKTEFLTNEDKIRKEEIKKIVANSGIPYEIINSFKGVSKVDKVKIYNKIRLLSNIQRQKIADLCQKCYYDSFDWDGFDVFCDVVVDCVKEETLKNLMVNLTKNHHRVLTARVAYYLQDGLFGVIRNEKDYYHKKTDAAIRNAASTVFNLFRYQLAKYLGLFDLLYRYVVSCKKGVKIDDVIGLSVLIQKLEYGSTIEKAKKVNDYGVPFSIVKYYEKNDMRLVNQFDDYEVKVFNKIKDLF